MRTLMRTLNLLKANIRKEYLEMRRYLPNTVAVLVTFYIIFLGMFTGIQVVGDPSASDMNTQYAIVNYIFWFMAMMVVNEIGFGMTGEATRGTLEQLSMSPMGIWRIILARLIASLILNFVLIFVLLYASMLTSGQWLNLDFITILPILILTLISMCGLGFIIAGMSITIKQIQGFLNILQFLIAGLTFVPLSVAPFLAFFPFVKGVDLIRDVMINGVTLTQISISDYSILIVNAVIYFIIGLRVFLYCERIAMKKGLLGQY